MSLMESILERNISAENLNVIQKQMEDFFLRTTNSLKAAIPQLSITKIQLLLHSFVFLIEGGWHTAHPSPVMDELLETKGYEIWRRNTEEDLSNTVFYLIKGMIDE